MNVTIEKNGNVNAVITVSLEEKDYQDKVTKDLKTIGLKHRIDGFRPGKVPAGILKKMFGKQVLADVVNRETVDALFNFIKENNLSVLGEPLAEESQEVDLSQKEYTFKFEVGLAPEFNVELSNNDTIDYYDINVTDEMVDQQVKMYTQRTAKYDKVEEYQDNDMLKGLLAELDENGNTKEGGLQVEGAVMMPTYMKNDDQKAIFNGAKTNTVLVFNPATAFDNNEAELASLLKIKKEEVANYKGNFSFQIEEITRMIPGDLNQELFDQVLGEGKAHSEEEFRAQIKETIAKQFEADSDYKFLIDVRNYVVNKIGKLEFADELMKRIMLENNKEKGEEFVAEHYEKSLEELTWHLIKEKLVAANDIKVEQADITNMAKEATRAQFAQYGMINVPDELLENYSKEMLKKRESVEALVNRVIETKLSDILKGQVTLNHKAVSAEEFNKMFQ